MNGRSKKDEDPGLDLDDLGLDEVLDIDGDESVGLDDDAGVDESEPLFALEMPPETAATDEAEDVDAIPVEGIGLGDEYGWTDGSEADTETPVRPEDVDLVDLPALGLDDGGEEGVDDTFELSELPALARAGDDDDAPLGDELFGGPVEDTLARLEGAGGVGALPLLEPPGCEVEAVAPTCSVLSADAPAPTLAGGAGIYRVDASLHDMESAGLDRATVASIVRDGDRVVVGLRPAAARWSTDGGASFEPSSGLDRAGPTDGPLLLCREPGTDRVWARTAGGALLRSEDFGVSFLGPLLLRRVVALAATRSLVYALSVSADGGAQLAWTSDGGERWAAADAPRVGSGAVAHLAVDGRALVIGAPDDPLGPHLSRDGGKKWSRLPGIGATGPIALVREEGGLALYAAHHLPDEARTVVARHRPDGGEGALVLDLEDTPEDAVHAVYAQVDGEVTRFAVATERGLFRGTVRVDEIE